MQSNKLELEYFQEQLELAQKMVAVLRYSFERATPIAHLITDVTQPRSQAPAWECLWRGFAARDAKRPCWW